VEGKRITKFLIVSVVIIVTILSITINSEFALASATGNNATTAIKPEGVLHIGNIIRANCGEGGPSCPNGSNTGMLTKVIFGGETHNFPAGRCCGTGWGKYTDYNIPVNDTFKITGEENVRCLDKEIGGVLYTTWCIDAINIQGTPPFGTGGCSAQSVSEPSCEAKMGPNGANMLVNYHWKSMLAQPAK
jgi:hypothetical protein